MKRITTTATSERLRITRSLTVGLLSTAVGLVALPACEGPALWTPGFQSEGFDEPEPNDFDTACGELQFELDACPNTNGQSVGGVAEGICQCLVDSTIDVCAAFFDFQSLSAADQGDALECYSRE